MKDKEYLVLVSDVVAKQIRIKANSEQDALTKAGSGDWFDSQVEKEECIKVEDVDGYGKTISENITGRHVNDLEGDEPTTWTKIEECVPMEDTDMDTDERYLNYEDPDWTKDDIEWRKNEDGTDIEVR